MSSINNNFVFGQSRPGKYSTVYNNNPDQKFYNMCKLLSHLILSFYNGTNI